MIPSWNKWVALKRAFFGSYASSYSSSSSSLLVSGLHQLRWRVVGIPSTCRGSYVNPEELVVSIHHGQEDDREKLLVVEAGTPRLGRYPEGYVFAI